MRADFHVHLDAIGAPHNTPAPTSDEVRHYAAEEGIELLGAIYEQEETLRCVRAAGLRVFPFFWERDPSHPRVPDSARGLKLHPYIDRYVLGAETVGPAMAVARERGMPVLIHSEDREPQFSRGRHFVKLAEAFPEVPIVIAHSGSYAPCSNDEPRRCLIDENLVRELVAEAIAATVEHANLYLEVCILASSVKADLIARKAPLERVLLGSDFPIGKGLFGSVRFQENALRRAGLSEEQVRGLHENAFRLLSPELV
jgi:predicted TIM-barrel fold metal-dependent hydrolase